jgi:hypothetical protein
MPIVSVLNRVRQFLKRLLLRGPLLAWWAARRTRQWERAYCKQLILSEPAPVPAAAPPALAQPGALRTILFIADCMWEQNQLLPELRKIADVVALDLRPRLKTLPASSSRRECVAASVRAFAEAEKTLEPDVILFYARPELLSEEVFDILRQRWHCPLFGMNLDDKYEFFPYGIFSDSEGNYQHWARRFDLNLTSSLAATDWYRQQGLACLYAPEGVHRSDGMQPPASADFKYALSFLGSYKRDRGILIDRLAQLGVEVEVFGSGWPRSQWVEDPNAVFRNSQLNLGIGLASESSSLTTLKGRDFECPGVGACYLTTYNWELACHFELGKEILCYRSVEELLEMYTYYRKRPEDCLAIARAAWRRCSNEHTWELRFRRIFEQAGFKLK